MKQNYKQREVKDMFEIKEVQSVEATGSLVGKAIYCAGTWGAAFILMAAVGC